MAVPLINVQQLIRIDAADACNQNPSVGNPANWRWQDSLRPLVVPGPLSLDIPAKSDEARPQATNIVLLWEEEHFVTAWWWTAARHH